MKKRFLFTLALIITILFYYFQFKLYKLYKTSEDAEKEKRNEVTIVVVTCGNRLNESLTMIKSVIMFSKAKLNFIVVTEKNLMQSFEEKLTEWKRVIHFSFELMQVTFPVGEEKAWHKLFRLCASQRLFLPSILKDIESMLYIDSDVLFLAPVEDSWKYFAKMNSSQMVALVPEHEIPHAGVYKKSSPLPFYGEFGVNSGIMLMNLWKMRAFKWEEYAISIYKKYKSKLKFGDQDIINIIFHFHPDKLYELPCRYNFRSDHCAKINNVCKSAEDEGVAALHGNRASFHKGQLYVFQSIYRAFKEFQIGKDIYHDFYLPLESNLQKTMETNCGRIKDIYLKSLRKHINTNDKN